jgi:organic radical activating enzyme
LDSKLIKIAYPFSISFQDYPDPYFCSLVIYLTGCEHNCINCHNPQFQNAEQEIEGTVEIHVNTAIRLVNEYMQKNDQVNAITLEGGEPLFGNNLIFTKKLCEEYGSKYSIAIYTGYSNDYVKEQNITGFRFLKCGKYDEKKKQESFKDDYRMQLASKNQNFYDAEYKQLSKNGVLNFF